MNETLAKNFISNKSSTHFLLGLFLIMNNEFCAHSCKLPLSILKEIEILESKTINTDFGWIEKPHKPGHI